MDGLLNQQTAIERLAIAPAAQPAVVPAAVVPVSTRETRVRRYQWGLLALIGVFCSGGCQILSPGGMTVVDRVPAALHEYPAGSRVRIQVYESPIPGGRGSNRGTYEGVVAASSPEQITLQNATHDRWMPDSLVMMTSVPVLGRYMSAGGRPTRTFEAAVTIEVDRVDDIELLKPADGKTVETLMKTRLEPESPATAMTPSSDDEAGMPSRDTDDPFGDATDSDSQAAGGSDHHDVEEPTTSTTSVRSSNVGKTTSRFGKSSRGASMGSMSTAADSASSHSSDANSAAAADVDVDVADEPADANELN